MKTLIFAVLMVGSFSASAEWKYLGDLSSNQYAPNSISNPYGRYGSEYSRDSINNPYGRYGSKYSNQSPNNPYATDAPKLIDSGDGVIRIYGDDGY